MSKTNFQKSASASQNVTNFVATGHRDWLGHFPNDIIYEILSHMETIDAIRFSATLKKWNHFWTSIPILYFNSKSFKRLCDFKNFINWALAHRGNSKIKVLIYYHFGEDHATDQHLLSKVFEYAASHDVEEIRINLHEKISGCPPFNFPLALFDCKSLKKLELKDCCHEKFFHSFGFDSLDMLHLEHFKTFPTVADYLNPFARLEKLFGFTTLTTLHLNSFDLSKTKAERLDPFADCVNLKTLHLTEMSFELDLNPEALVISSPKLSSLNLMCNRFRCTIAVSSPELLSFNYLYSTPYPYIKFSRPSLARLIIEIYESLAPSKGFHPNTGDEISHGLVNMLRGHHEAEEVKVSLYRVVVMCGAAALKKLECAPRSKSKSWDIAVGSDFMEKLYIPSKAYRCLDFENVAF